ncbi:hypothetical protein BDQ17DRAFT_242809 [Cyathus striatus]|nr:hypothetical protein BDQ17DRAFT_242809 [Cyathus striatus]
MPAEDFSKPSVRGPADCDYRGQFGPYHRRDVAKRIGHWYFHLRTREQESRKHARRFRYTYSYFLFTLSRPDEPPSCKNYTFSPHRPRPSFSILYIHRDHDTVPMYPTCPEIDVLPVRVWVTYFNFQEDGEVLCAGDGYCDCGECSALEAAKWTRGVLDTILLVRRKGR